MDKNWTWIMAALCLATGIAKADDVECLAKNIYFESRNQPYEGQLEVALVTMNRVYSSDFPNTVCEVVYQPKQFSWYWDGLSDIPREAEAWANSIYLAVEIYVRYEWMDDSVKQTLFFKREDTPSRYFNSLTHVITIGDHEFFK
jgi:spore germination cell wall hydrolase CwlJ-like protein